MSQQHISPWRERLTSPLTWHYVGLGLLLAVTIFLAVRVGLDWAAIDSHASDVLAGKQVELKAMQLQTAPLRGLDKRVEQSRQQVNAFYAKRIPPNYSTISGRIGELEVASGVRLTRVEYTQGKPGSDLTEISLDASITGEYPAIMHFINSLERDPIFFLIEDMTLTGQQGGTVSLRMQVSTWLRPADALASGLPPTPSQSAQPAENPAASKEGE
ncbi:MAG TPA: GspMb/PilO family protein [Terracidiphilus sp.]|jgi:Tfp pilus assembly protein PilO|nr:GspMb/PilO family protein [Terracidiphilus sp.]